jgi:uncharacterized protein
MRLPVLVFMLFCVASIHAQNTILWSVTHPGTAHRSYLLGTMHQLGNSFVDALPVIEASMRECEVAIFESVDTSGTLIAQLNSRPESDAYRSHFKPKQLAVLDRLATDWSVPLGKVNPVELLIKLKQEYDLKHCNVVKPGDTWSHFDNYLEHLARGHGLEVMGLETDSMQTVMINQRAPDLSWERRQRPIEAAITDLDKGRNSARQCRLTDQYMCLSFNYQFDQICGEDPGLKGRNMAWMPLLAELLDSHDVFVAVGLLHLYGDCGLIMQLRGLGYAVEPVEMVPPTSHCKRQPRS